MAEAIGFVASIAGLLGVAITVSKELRDIQRLYTNAPFEIQDILKEVEGTISIVQELHNCLSDFQQDASTQPLDLSNIDPIISTATRVLKNFQCELASLKTGAGIVKNLKRIRWVVTQREIERQCQTIQRLKLTLLLKLSLVSLRTDLQLREAGTSNRAVLDGAVSSMSELRLSVQATQTLLVKILDTTENLDKQSTDFREDVIRQINACIPVKPQIVENVGDSYRNGVSNYQQTSQSQCTDVSLSAVRKTSALGDLELVVGALKLFQPGRLRLPNGVAFRATYVPPPWLVRMVISLSLGVGISPSLGLRFSLTTAAVVHFDSDIFWFARHNRIDGIKDLFRSGKAAPTDRDLDGWTALHEAAAQCNKPLCEFLLYEDADNTAISLPFANNELTLTPVGWLTLSKKFRQLPKKDQADFLAVFGIFGSPSNSEIRVTKKSPAQLLFNTVQAEYDEGPLGPEDLQTMDMNRRGSNGTTALMLAAGIGHVDAVQALLKHGADINALDNGGWSALRQAAYYGHENCVEELLRQGADLWQRDLGVYGPRRADDPPDNYGYAEMWDRVMQRLKDVTPKTRDANERGTVVQSVMEDFMGDVTRSEEIESPPPPKAIRRVTSQYSKTVSFTPTTFQWYLLCGLFITVLTITTLLVGMFILRRLFRRQEHKQFV